MCRNFILVVMCAFTISCTAEPTSDHILGQAPQEPSVFMSDVVSVPERYEYGSVFNSDLTEFYFGVQNDGWSDIRMMRRVGADWSEPETVFGSSDLSANDPFLSNDDDRLYFISPRKGQYDIGYVTRLDNESWGSPVFPSMPINSEKNEYYISFTNDSSMVFSSDRNASEGGDFDIYLSRSNENGYQAEVPFPDTVNTSNYEADAFIAQDESYIIFSANRPEGLGRGDLYISFAEKNGAWSESVSMGSMINSEGHELCPFVSKDGQYFFFTSKEDIYWVSTDIFEGLRPDYGAAQ